MHYFTPHLYNLLPHVSFHFYSNSLLYNELVGLHIYCTQVVKFSLTHKQRSKDQRMYSASSVGISSYICRACLDICLCMYSSLMTFALWHKYPWPPHTQLVEIMDINIFTLLSVLFMHCSANEKCPVNCKCQDIMSVCDILFCNDELYVHTTLLMVEGCMCPHHYDVLLQHPELYKKLMDSYCSNLEWGE